jgi:hypothetical protein
MKTKVNVNVEIDGRNYLMNKDVLPQDGDYVIVINAGCLRGGDVPYDNLDVFQVKSVIRNQYNHISGVEVTEPVLYFTNLDASEYAVLVEI